MKPSEKSLSSLQTDLSRLGSLAPAEALRSMTASVDRALGSLPQGLKTEVVEALEGKIRSEPGRAADWLMAVASVLLMDYADEVLSLEEWRELRDMVSNASEELEMDVLEYAMGLVLDHGAL